MTDTPRQRAPRRKPDGATTKRRLRLTPELRRQQILDAALVEFGSLGFTAASISRIANRAGTSKANLYVHFANKDEIFETLLRDLLIPANTAWSPGRGQDLKDSIDSFVDRLYGAMDHKVLAVIRLLVAESHRVPTLIQRWHEEIMLPARAEQQRQIDAHVAAGVLRASPLTEYFAFATAPLLSAAITKIVFGQAVADAEVEKIKETHRRMLHHVLVPRGEA